MDLDTPTPLLGGLSPVAFMRRHWHKRPLLVRQAWPGVAPPLARAALFALAGRDEVESRLVLRSPGQPAHRPEAWQVRHGPFRRRALPPAAQPGWTLLVQGLDLHVPAAQAMLQPFRFIPGARLDDLMLSWASDGGGVGPHLDSYDVFLLQVQGRRRWRIAPVDEAADAALVRGAPLKLLRRFRPQQEWLLEPGDLLYLPPRWAHDGVAEGECMTASVGFRAPSRSGLAAELLQRLAGEAGDAADDETAGGASAARAGGGGGGGAGAGGALYRDPRQPATAAPGAVPPALRRFAAQALAQALRRPGAVDRALGEALTEPKPRVWFDALPGARAAAARRQGVRLAPGSRMLYDERHVFLNGESFLADGRDAELMRQLADQGELHAAGCRALSAPARALLRDWLDDGWLQPRGGPR
jgi:50S ribosomal protein L16 3-hydroxylase